MKLKNCLALVVALSLTACGFGKEAESAAKSVAQGAETADQICAMVPFSPAGKEKDAVAELCAKAQEADRLAGIVARCEEK
jgi:hypothetical protein